MSSERRGFRFWLGRNDVVHNHPSQNRNNLRKIKERIAGRGFFLATWFPLAVLLAIVIALLVRTWPLLGVVSPWEILSGQTWKPLQGLFGSSALPVERNLPGGVCPPAGA
jgi:ABC-type phosphate transport system permease subunit